MTKRENRQERRKPYRHSADRMLVVCGGRLTEPGYFDGMKKLYRNAAVKIVVKAIGGSPVDLIRYAIAVQGRQSDPYDEIWCVTDVDDFDVDSAVALAAKEDISLAVSNPCFEVWLLLHFETRTAAVAGYSQAKRILCRHVPGYDKDCGSFEKFRPGVQDAIERAKALSDFGTEHHNNPSTGVWALVQRFDRN